MWKIKAYTKKLTIELKDWTKLYSEKTLTELHLALNSWGNFIEIDWVLFNIYEFKKAYIEKINSVSDYIISLPKEQQIIIQEREEYLKKNLNKRFKNINQIKRYLHFKNNK